MNILIIGNGAREHALAYKLSQDESVQHIMIAPGNGGTATENRCFNIDIQASDIEALLHFAKTHNIDLTITGSEESLALGIVDLFQTNNLMIFGPTKAAAMIESSKSFAKEIMASANIPTAKYQSFTDYNSAVQYIKDENIYPIVIKADGLAAGKGVTIVNNLSESETILKSILYDKRFGNAGNTVVIEEFMQGEEATYLAITDGEDIIPLDISQDHKQVYDNDRGANTGGMGAYSPAPIIDDAKFKFVTDNIAYPMIRELKKRGIIYRGVIYVGLMIESDLIRVVEFNARFGDPECQVVLSRIDAGLLDLLKSSALGDISSVKLKRNDNKIITVVLASGGYPESYKTGYEINGLAIAEKPSDIKIFHAGTVIVDDKFLTAGGRVVSVTASAKTLQEAQSKAYAAIENISFTDMHYRKDIASKALK